MTLDELIAALEQAKGPSRELNAEIAMLYTPGLYPRIQEARDGAANYTGSIDDALTLLPKTAHFTINENEGECWVFEERIVLAAGGYPVSFCTGYSGAAWAKDGKFLPAAALCIAALKASNTQGKGEAS